MIWERVSPKARRDKSKEYPTIEHCWKKNMPNRVKHMSQTIKLKAGEQDDWAGDHCAGDSIFRGVIFDAARERYALLKECAIHLVQNLLPYKIVNRFQMGRTAPEGLGI